MHCLLVALTQRGAVDAARAWMILLAILLLSLYMSSVTPEPTKARVRSYSPAAVVLTRRINLSWLTRWTSIENNLCDHACLTFQQTDRPPVGLHDASGGSELRNYAMTSSVSHARPELQLQRVKLPTSVTTQLPLLSSSHLGDVLYYLTINIGSF